MTPISRVRSVTLTSMTLAIPIAPTTSAMTAIPVTNRVIRSMTSPTRSTKSPPVRATSSVPPGASRRASDPSSRNDWTAVRVAPTAVGSATTVTCG